MCLLLLCFLCGNSLPCGSLSSQVISDQYTALWSTVWWHKVYDLKCAPLWFCMSPSVTIMCFQVKHQEPGYKVIEVEQCGELRVLWISRVFRTYLDVTEDARDAECLKTDFKLLRSVRNEILYYDYYTITILWLPHFTSYCTLLYYSDRWVTARYYVITYHIIVCMHWLLPVGTFAHLDVAVECTIQDGQGICSCSVCLWKSIAWSHHVILSNIISYRIISDTITSYHIISHHIVSYCHNIRQCIPVSFSKGYLVCAHNLMTSTPHRVCCMSVVLQLDACTVLSCATTAPQHTCNSYPPQPN